MKDFLAHHWFTLLLAAFIGLAIYNNAVPPPEPERSQVLWPPPPKRSPMPTGPCTDWKSGLTTGDAPPEAKRYLDALARQLQQAAIIGESDEAPGGRLSREGRGLGLRAGYVPGESGQRGRIELSIIDLCRLFLLDHSSEPLLDSTTPEITAAAIRARIDRLMPGSYRSPIAEIVYVEPLDEAPPEPAIQLREAIRALAGENDELLIRETADVKLRLDGARLNDTPPADPVAALVLGIRVGRYGSGFVAHLSRKIPSEGEETIEGATVGELAENVMNRMKRIAYAR